MTKYKVYYDNEQDRAKRITASSPKEARWLFIEEAEEYKKKDIYVNWGLWSQEIYDYKDLKYVAEESKYFEYFRLYKDSVIHKPELLHLKHYQISCKCGYQGPGIDFKPIVHFLSRNNKAGILFPIAVLFLSLRRTFIVLFFLGQIASIFTPLSILTAFSQREKTVKETKRKCPKCSELSYNYWEGFPDPDDMAIWEKVARPYARFYQLSNFISWLIILVPIIALIIWFGTLVMMDG